VGRDEPIRVPMKRWFKPGDVVSFDPPTEVEAEVRARRLAGGHIEITIVGSEIAALSLLPPRIGTAVLALPVMKELPRG
jgi:hypothetical protein